MTKLVIYTVLVGDKETLNNPLKRLPATATSDLELEFVCFTDNPALTSSVWSFRPIPERLIPPNRLSRLPKALPHLLFPDEEYSLYIDNTVAFKRLPQASDLGEERGTVFRAFRHPWRSCPQDEADVVVRSGLDDVGRIIAQTQFYDRRSPLADIKTLTAGTVLLRRHHDPRVRKFGEWWWEQILLFSARDQLSLDQCALATNCPIDHFPGTKRDSDLIEWPALDNPRRVEGSFDADRYAWEHRRDPEAWNRPAAHFLAHGNRGEYQRPSAIFAYCCARARSGLGDHAPPGRGIAAVLEPLLARITDPARVLLTGILSDRDYAADPVEIAPAKQAVELRFRFGPAVQVIPALINDDDVGDPAPFRSAGDGAGFRVALVFGLSPRHYQNALAKFLPLLERGGSLVVQFGESLTPDMILEMQRRAQAPGTLSAYHSRHVSRTEPVPASLFVYELA